MNFLKIILNHIYFLNFKTFYFNFKYLPFNQAIKFPILISRYTYLKNCTGNIKINSKKIKTGMIGIGKNGVGIFDEKKSRSIWEVSGQVIFSGKCIIGHGSKISVGDTACLEFGDNFVITAESSIVCQKKITFGNDCLLSWEILIMDTDFHKIKSLDGNILNPSSEIFIGNHVWIGCKSLILKGSVISDNNIIGANSLVSSKLLQSNSVYAGNPVRIVKQDISWEL